MSNLSTLSGTPPPVIFPKNLNLGDTWAFEMAAGDYGVPPWAALLTFATGTTRLVSTATLQQGIFYWLIASSDTAALPPGPGTLVYTIAVQNAVTGEYYTLQEGTVQTLANLQDASVSVPTQSILQQQLAACDATLLQLLSQRTSSVVFAGKAYTLWDVAKLWQVRSDLALRVANEQASLSGNSRAQIIIPVFKNPWGGPYPSAPWYPYGW